MDRQLFIDFNKVYTEEPTKEERQLTEDFLLLWAKFETAAAKSPAILRKGIYLGIALGKAIEKRQIIPRPLRQKRKAKTARETEDSGQS